MIGLMRTTASKWCESSDSSLTRPSIHNMPTPNTSAQRTQPNVLRWNRALIFANAR